MNIETQKFCKNFLILVCERYMTHRKLCFENFSTDFSQIGSRYGFELTPENVGTVRKIYDKLIETGVIK